MARTEEVEGTRREESKQHGGNMGRSFFGGEKVRVREGAMVRSFFVGCKGIRKGDL